MESHRIEYKRELNEAFEKSAVAFLNYHDGGVINIGIDDSANVVGIHNVDAMQLSIKDRFKNNILPSCMGLFDVIHEKREGKDIIKIVLVGGTEKP